MLLPAAQQLNESKGDVVVQDEELAAMVMLPDVAAQYLAQIAESPIVEHRKFQIHLPFQIEQGFEQSHGRVVVEMR